MKKLVVFFLFAILGIETVFAQKGISFENGGDKALVEIYKEPNLEKILEKAKKENKIVFIDCYTSWCAPCKQMSKNVFTNDTIGDFFNSHFVCIKMDMEKGEGKVFAKKYEIGCYPTFLFLDGNGNVIYRISSSYSVQEFFEIGKKVLLQEKPYYILENEYKKDSLSRQDFISYMKLRKTSCLEVDSEVQKYFTIFSSDSENARLDWSVIRDFGLDINSPTFKFLVSNKEIFYQVYTKDSVNNVIENLYKNEFDKCFYPKFDSLNYLSLKAELLSSDFVFSQKLITTTDLNFFSITKDWKKYANVTVTYVDNYLKKDDYLTLNELAWVFYKHIDAVIYLDMAIDWAKCSVELHKETYNMDTYACLLFKTKKYEEALKVAEEAVQFQKEAGQNPPDTEKLLNEIKKAMK
ncbi:MAG: thioredoxin family protein [Candidatus Paceibacterota bacterium]|jgi:thiol-disulfide isomerase/thioredoxin